MVQSKWMNAEKVQESINRYRQSGGKVHFVEFLYQGRYIDGSKYQQLRNLLSGNVTTHISSSEGGKSPSWEINNTFSRYRVERELGQGGMGRVCLGFDKILKRQVAIKICLSQEADLLTRFMKEAQVGSQLEHPNIAPVYDGGLTPEGKIFFSMKYIEGISLDEILENLKEGRDEEKYPLSRRLEIFSRVLEGISYAHSKGIINRDIKPENIMVGTFGEVWVVDWGLAKIAEGEGSFDELETRHDLSTLKEIVTTKTLDGAIAGTPGYMSPEQAYGDHENVSLFSDIYSLGVILYEILTLQRAFVGKNALEILHKTVANDYLLPSQAAPRIPGALEAITLTAMAFRSEDRYPSCQAMLEDVQAYLEGRPVSVYTPPFRERARTLLNQYSEVLLVLCIILSLVAGFGYLLAREQKQRAEEQRQRVEEQKKTIQAKEEKGKLLAKKLEAEKKARKLEEGKRKAEEGKRKAEEGKRKAEEDRRKSEEESKKRFRALYEASQPYTAARDQMLRNMKFGAIKQFVIPKLKKAIHICPQFYQARLELVRVYGFLSQEKKALGALLGFFTNMPAEQKKKYQPLINAAQQLIFFKNAPAMQKNALAVFTSFFEKNRPEEVDEMYWKMLKVLFLFQLKLEKQALRGINQILEIPAGQTWENYFLKSRILSDGVILEKNKTLQKEKWEIAKKFFAENLKRYPQIPYFYTTRAKTFFLLGHYSEAFRDLLRVLILDPTCDVAYFDGAKIYFFIGVSQATQKKPPAQVIAPLLAALRCCYQGFLLEPDSDRHSALQAQLLQSLQNYGLPVLPHSIMETLKRKAFIEGVKKLCLRYNTPELWKEWAILLHDYHSLRGASYVKKEDLQRARKILKTCAKTHPQDLDQLWIEKIFARLK